MVSVPDYIGVRTVTAVLHNSTGTALPIHGVGTQRRRRPCTREHLFRLVLRAIVGSPNLPEGALGSCLTSMKYCLIPKGNTRDLLNVLETISHRSGLSLACRYLGRYNNTAWAADAHRARWPCRIRAGANQSPNRRGTRQGEGSEGR